MSPKMFDKSVNTYPSTTQFVPKCYKTKQICHKTIDLDVFLYLIWFSDLDQYKSPEMCDRVLSEDPVLVVYCPNRYKTQTIRDEAVDDSVVVLKFIPDWFVRNKMLEKSDN